MLRFQLSMKDGWTSAVGQIYLGRDLGHVLQKANDIGPLALNSSPFTASRARSLPTSVAFCGSMAFAG
jgi:hypothetical protein